MYKRDRDVLSTPLTLSLSSGPAALPLTAPLSSLQSKPHTDRRQFPSRATRNMCLIIRDFLNSSIIYLFFSK